MTWKIVGKRFGIMVTVCAVVGMVVYFGGTKIQKAVSTIAPEEETPVIVLDAEHGGIDGGCSSVNGVPEKGD
ncbi:MAG: hypothetical protein LIO74_09780 [Ruminococcus sp.]|nr:hypothetical protein [Ruminococcus sp.]